MTELYVPPYSRLHKYVCLLSTRGVLFPVNYYKKINTIKISITKKICSCLLKHFVQIERYLKPAAVGKCADMTSKWFAAKFSLMRCCCTVYWCTVLSRCTLLYCCWSHNTGPPFSLSGIHRKTEMEMDNFLVTVIFKATKYFVCKLVSVPVVDSVVKGNTEVPFQPSVYGYVYSKEVCLIRLSLYTST